MQTVTGFINDVYLRTNAKNEQYFVVRFERIPAESEAGNVIKLHL